MQVLPTPVERQAAPELAARLHVILTGLIQAITVIFLKDPRHVALIVPLCTRLVRTGRRFTRLMARVAAGTAALRRRTGARSPTVPAAPPPPRFRLPGRMGWLLHTLRLHPRRHEIAFHTNRLDELLATPGAAAIFATAPQAARHLRALCRFLGVAHPLVPTARTRRRAPDRPAAPSRPETAPEPSVALEPLPPPEPCRHHARLWHAPPPPRPAPRRLLFDPAILPFFLTARP